MRNRNNKKTGIYGMILLFLTAVLTGCGNRKPETGGAEGMEPNVPDLYAQGTLKEIRYEFSGGDMVYHSTFLADVTAQEIVEAEYWPEDATEIERIEQQPITAEQWEPIVRSVNQLRQFMTVLEEPEPVEDDGEELIVLDGGDYQNLFLTFEADDMEETFSCRIPQDRRFETLRILLYELVDPKGREVIWYDAPEISGIWFRNQKEEYSYQVTKFDSEEQYKLRAYWKENGQKQSLITDINDEDWEEVRSFCKDQQMLELPEGYQDEIGGTLYLSDGRQYSYHVDERSAETYRAFFADLTKRIQSR